MLLGRLLSGTGAARYHDKHMSLSWKCRALAVVAVGLPACSSQQADSAGMADESPPQPPDQLASLTFDAPGTLQLVPGERRTVWVTGKPPAPYEVIFNILGDAAGAWLDRTTVLADRSGRASVQLHASSVESTFRLRAATPDGLSAEIGVAVSAKGFGTLRVMPIYEGVRAVDGWTASVVAGATCKEIAQTSPEAPAGALLVEGAPEGPIVVERAPAGTNLAVALRNGRAMWGCVDERELRAGGTRDVWVQVKDLPIDLAATSLHAKLTITSATGLDELLDASIQRIVDGFLPEGKEAASLLDAMALAAPVEQASAFAEQRRALGWDAAAQAHLAALPLPVRERCRGWARAGLTEMPRAIVGRLEGERDAPEHPRFEASWLGTATAGDKAGGLQASSLSWTAEPGDVLRLSGTLPWNPRRYVAEATALGAAADMPEAGSIAAALAAAAECRVLGASLGGYGDCDEGCMAALCAGGLKLLWRAGVEGSGATGATGEIVVNAAGPAQVDRNAAPVAWTADWLGSIRDGEGAAASVQGQARAVSSEESL